jgi:threonine/homoserine/homoserine lactone efflux protein
MEIFILLIKAGIIGFIIAMPLGPIGTLCIRHSLLWGIKEGLATGLGVAVADMLYALLTGLSIVTLIDTLLYYQFWFQLIGSLFICYFGVQIVRNEPFNKFAAFTHRKSLFQLFATALFITLTNPATILIFAGIYASLGEELEKVSLGEVITFAVGIFWGSTLWWILLSSTAALFKHRLTVKMVQRFNVLSGIILVGFGFMILLSGIKSYLTH